RLADLRVGEFGPGIEQEGVEMVRWDVAQGFDELSTNAGSIDSGIDPVEGLEDRVDGRPGVGAELAQLVPVMPSQEIGRDAEQPGPRVGAREVIAGAVIEGDEEGLSGELVGEIAADSALQIRMD